MSGVYMTEKLLCTTCHEVTEHNTSWESEFPNVIWVQCIPCFGERQLSCIYPDEIHKGKITYCHVTMAKHPRTVRP